jgi:hypothetical protein
MANSRIKASVHVNELDPDGRGVILKLTAQQAATVLERVVSGEVLHLSLVTGDFDERELQPASVRAIHENPAAYAQ